MSILFNLVRAEGYYLFRKGKGREVTKFSKFLKAVIVFP